MGVQQEQRAASAADDGIRHVVLLMLENHSFDQMLGGLQEELPDLDGATAASASARSNPKLDGSPVFQHPTTDRQAAFDPKHEHVNVLAQLDGGNSGFVREFQKAYPKCTDRDLHGVMGYYPAGFLPALHVLARAFTVCDRWFSSLPGPTWPNRFFALTGTCRGEVLMPDGEELLDPRWYTQQDQATLLVRLNEAGRSWRVYHYDFALSLVLARHRMPGILAGYAPIADFFSEAAGDEAAFPDFAFIEPQYFGAGQNDGHPPHNVMKSEKLVADVYNALRSNPRLWEATLLVVVFDEHGGFYDHVPPPATVAPDDSASAFPFTQLGVRVPALLVSPRCARRVEHQLFDHTSVLKYLTDKWGLGPLGARTAQANSIACALLPPDAAPRTDTPPFVRVPNAELIAPDPQAEADSTNANQAALHHFAEFLRAQMEGGVAGADAAGAAGAWVGFKHAIGRALSAAGAWASRDMRTARQQRLERTAQILQALKDRQPPGG